MLKSQGQFFIITFVSTPMDDAQDKLDHSKWCKYDNLRASATFYKTLDAAKEYRKIIESLAFQECYAELQPDYFAEFSEDKFNGK